MNASPSVSLDEVYSEFRLACEARRLSPDTLRFYDQRWRKTRSILIGRGIRAIQAIKPRLLRELQVELDDSHGYSQHSIHDTMRFVRAFLNFAREEGFINESPMDKVRMPRLDRRILPAFSKGDIDKLLGGCDNARDRTIVLTLLDTGLRVSELVALNIADIDLVAGKIKVQRGKGGKGRTVFLGARTTNAIQSYLQTREEPLPDAPLCASQTTGRRLTANGLRQMLRRLGRRTGVKGCNPHKFRRTFALWSLKKGMNIHALARIMGHADISVLRQYLPFVDDDLQEAHRSHGPVDHFLTSAETEVAS